MFRAPAMLLPHESTVGHEQHFAAEVVPESDDLEEEKRQTRVSFINFSTKVLWQLFAWTERLFKFFFADRLSILPHQII